MNSKIWFQEKTKQELDPVSKARLPWRYDAEAEIEMNQVALGESRRSQDHSAQTP